MNELQECHRLVWAFRKEIEPYWATPDPLNSLRYAFCEAAEGLDAWLRAERPSDSRNNDRNNDILDELADCAIMLLTALPDGDESFTGFVYPGGRIYDPDDLDIIVEYVAQSLKSEKNETPNIHKISACVWRIGHYPGMELKQRIQGRLTRIAFKHMPLFESAKLIDKFNLPPPPEVKQIPIYE